MKETVNKPNHYIGEHGLEVEEVLRNFLTRYTNSYEAHRIASAIEYLLRSPLKNGTEDLQKAKRNIEQVLEYRGINNDKIKVGDIVNVRDIDDGRFFEQVVIVFISNGYEYVDIKTENGIYRYRFENIEITK